MIEFALDKEFTSLKAVNPAFTIFVNQVDIRLRERFDKVISNYINIWFVVD